MKKHKCKKKIAAKMVDDFVAQSGVKEKKDSITSIIVISIIVCIVFASCHGTSKDNDSGTDDAATEVSKVDTQETANSENVYSNAKVEFDKGDYAFITNNDLDKYCTNLVGIKIYVVGEVGDFNDGNIQISLSDKYMYSTFYSDVDYSNYVKAGDVVAIFGDVSGSDTYKLTGTSVEIKNCQVFAVGDEAKKYDLGVSDSRLEQYLVITDEVANNNSDQISKEDYISLCEKIDYSSVLRNPDDYKGKHTIVEGKVDQVIEGFFGGVTFYVIDASGNKWGCVYSYKEGESRVLEGDNVKFYGICKGTDTSETVLGEQVILVRVDVDYVD